MKVFISVVFVIVMIAVVLGFGLHQQYGSVTELPTFEAILQQLSNQNLKRPDSLMILSFYIAVSFAIPVFPLVALFAFKAKDEYGSARWANDSDIKKFGLNAENGVILGKFKGRFLRSSKPLSTLCVAPPGTGKTAGFVIPNVLSFNGSVVALDIKGEICEKTAAFRSQFSNVLVFEPAYKTNKIGFNPFDSALLPDDFNDVVQLVYQVADLLFQSNKKESDHWIIEAKSLFAFFALFMIYNKQSVSIPAIRAFALSSTNLQEDIQTMLEEHEDLPTTIRHLGNALVQKAHKEFSGIFSSFQTALFVFADEYIAAAFSFNSIFPDDFRKNATTLYFRIDDIDAERLSPCVRLFLDFFIKNLMRREATSEDLQLLFMLDEFPRFGRIPVLLKLPALGRSYGLLTMFFFQSNGQVVERYEKHGLDELDSTTAYKIILTLNEFQTAKAFSDSIGHTTRLIKKGKSTSNNDDFKSSSSMNSNLEGVPLLRPEELLSLEQGTAILLVQGHRKNPIKASVPFWFKDKQMKAAINPNLK